MINRELNTPYNTQHNGVAERKNRMIMEPARAMLHDQGLPMHLWVEASKTTVYVRNRTPHRVLENKTSEEVFSSKKLEVNHLRIFDCPVYIHIPKEKRTKLDPSGKKGIFVGYSESSKAYRIYFPDSRRSTSGGMWHLMKTQLTTNPERDLLKNLKKQKHPEFMIQPWMKKLKKKSRIWRTTKTYRSTCGEESS